MVSRKHFSKTLALAFLALGALSLPALAAEYTDQQIIEKLKAPKLTRSETSVIVASRSSFDTAERIFANVKYGGRSTLQ